LVWDILERKKEILNQEVPYLSPVIERRYWFIPFIALVLGAGVACLVYAGGYVWFFGLLGCILFSLFFLESPEYAFLFFIAVINWLWLSQIEIGTVSIGVGGVLNLALTFVGVLYILQRRANLRLIPIAVPFSLLILASIISTFHSPDKLQSMRWALRLFSMFVLYTLVLDIFRDKAKINRLLLTIVFSSIIPIAISIWQHVNKIGMTDSINFIRIYSIFKSPNYVGVYLMICLSSGLILLFNNTPRATKALVGVIGLASLYVLYLTFARVAWVGTLLMIVSFGLLIRRRNVLWLLISILFIAVLTPGIWQRLGPVLKSISGSLDPALAWRLHHLKQVVPILFSKILFGQGGGISRRLIFARWGLDKVANNGYLDLAIELGLVGLVSCLAILFSLAKQALWVYRNSRDQYLKTLSSSYLALLASWMLANMFHNFFTAHGGFTFILILGALIGSAKVITEQREADCWLGN
jgi:O-antigen ligase